MTSKERTLSKSPEKRELKWMDYIYGISSLSGKILLSKLQFEFVYGIPRGGLIPAVILSHSLNKKLLMVLDGFIPPKKVLIVDDIVDTGTTLKFYKDKGYNIATIFKHKNSPIIPDFYCKENDCWINFPYEKD